MHWQGGVRDAARTLLTLAAGNDENRAQITGGGGGEEQVRRAKAAANTTENTKKWGQMLLNRLAQCWKIKNNEGCHRRVLASCPRPRRLLVRSHVDSHDLAAESATAGQSVRRIQASAGLSAHFQVTATEVLTQ